MTKEQTIQAVIDKARKTNCDFCNEDGIAAELSTLYDNCESKLGPERFAFYKTHHRLTDLLYKLKSKKLDKDGVQGLDRLDQLDQFSLENDRELPRLLQADEHELSSPSKEIAEYDLYEYNPRLNPEQKNTKFEFNDNIKELLNFIFDDIMMPMAEQRARLYKKLRPLNEEMQKHIKRQKELAGDSTLANWSVWMLPSLTEQEYLESRIKALSPSVELLENKIDQFSYMLDKFCYELRSFERFPIRDITLDCLYIDPSETPLEEKLNCGKIYFSYNELTAQRTYTIKTPEGAIVTDNYSLSEIELKLPMSERLSLIFEQILKNGHATTKSTLRNLYSSVFRELNKYYWNVEDINGSNIYRVEKFPDQFNPLSDNLRTPTGRLEPKKQAFTRYSTECSKDEFCIFKSKTDVFEQRRHDILFYDFMRGLAGMVLVPLRKLFYAGASLLNYCIPTCNPENAPLQKRAFYSTRSSYLFNQTKDKFFKKSYEIERKYKDRDNTPIDPRIDEFDHKDIQPTIKMGMGS